MGNSTKGVSLEPIKWTGILSGCWYALHRIDIVWEVEVKFLKFLLLGILAQELSPSKDR